VTAPYDVYVIPHTHWDREWYHPAGRFRQRLVALLDELLDAEPGDAVPATFLLDGQAVVLDDYLTVRPDRAAALAARLAGGALEAGPWYVLADELIAGGEALVRNLLAGRRTLARFGAAPPPVLYSPDAFGHAAALPALAVGFGCDLVIAWRGLGGARWPAGDTFRWRAPDGSAALLYHLSPDGYELGSSLPADRHAAAERWTRLRTALEPRSTLGVLLVQNGADHHALQPRWRAAMRALVDAARPDRVELASLRRFAEEMSARAGSATLPEIAGELRDSYGYTWTLQGTFAVAHGAEAQKCDRGAHARARRRAVGRAGEAGRCRDQRAAARRVADAAPLPPARHAVRLLDRRGRARHGRAARRRRVAGGWSPARRAARARRPRRVGGARARDRVAQRRGGEERGGARARWSRRGRAAAAGRDRARGSGLRGGARRHARCAGLRRPAVVARRRPRPRCRSSTARSHTTGWSRRATTRATTSWSGSAP
jgi:hypothetical protein